MAFTWIDSQPIVPASLENCCTSDIERNEHIIDTNDVVQIQFRVEPCEGVESLEFDEGVVGGTFSFISGQVCSSGGVGTYDAQYFNLEYKGYLKLIFNIYSYTSGTLTLTFDGGQSFDFTGPGTYEIFTNPPPAADVVLNFTTSDFIGCFDQISEIYPVEDNYRLVLYTSEGIGVHTFTEPLFANDGTNYMTFVCTLSDLPELEEGCYYFGLLDPCVNECGQNGICNQDFQAFGQCWTNSVESGWTTDIQYQAILETTDNLNFLFTNDTELCEGNLVTITYTLTAVEGDAEFRMVLNGNGPARTEPGTYSEVHTVGGAGFNQIALLGRIGDGGGFISIEDILVEINPSNTVPAETSIVYQIKDINILTECLVKIGGCNQGEAFGFNFQLPNGTTFNPFVRIAGTIEGAQYPVDGELFQYKSGKVDTVYWDRRKTKSINISSAPEYIHDFLSLAIGFDNLYVNTFKIAPIESDYPELNWEANNTISNVSIPIQEQTQKKRKVRCSEVTITCANVALSGSQKEFEDGENFNFEDDSAYLLN